MIVTIPTYLWLLLVVVVVMLVVMLVVVMVVVVVVVRVSETKQEAKVEKCWPSLCQFRNARLETPL